MNPGSSRRTAGKIRSLLSLRKNSSGLGSSPLGWMDGKFVGQCQGKGSVSDGAVGVCSRVLNQGEEAEKKPNKLKYLKEVSVSQTWDLIGDLKLH